MLAHLDSYFHFIQAFAQLNAIQQLTGILHGAKGSWTVAYKAAVIATTAVVPVLALLSSCLVRILVTCKMDMILAKEGAMLIGRNFLNMFCA